jgi:hypothetical protein
MNPPQPSPSLIQATGQTSPKPFVFVLMPFSPEFADVYEVGIKAACRDAGAYCERVDEQIFTESILERVYNQIARADLVVADMTGRNPNVFYEVGYAHALNKRVILLTQEADDIPFDLKHYPHVIYGGSISTLKTEVEKRVRWSIENPQDSLTRASVELGLFVNGIPLGENPAIKLLPREDPLSPRMDTFFSGTSDYNPEFLRLNIGVHNPTSMTINPEQYVLALVIPDATGLGSESGGTVTRIGAVSVLYNPGPFEPLFPDGWHSKTITLFSYPNLRPAKVPIPMLLRLYTELGVRDYPFTVQDNRFWT